MITNEHELLEEITTALNDYRARMEHTKWLVDNGHLPANTDIGELVCTATFSGQSTFIVEAVVMMLELAHKERDRCEAFRAAFGRSDDGEYDRLITRQREVDRNVRSRALTLTRLIAQLD